MHNINCNRFHPLTQANKALKHQQWFFSAMLTNFKWQAEQLHFKDLKYTSSWLWLQCVELEMWIISIYYDHWNEVMWLVCTHQSTVSTAQTSWLSSEELLHAAVEERMGCSYYTCIHRLPSATWKPWKTCTFKFYLSRSRNSLEFVPKSKKTWPKQEF